MAWIVFWVAVAVMTLLRATVFGPPKGPGVIFDTGIKGIYSRYEEFIAALKWFFRGGCYWCCLQLIGAKCFSLIIDGARHMGKSRAQLQDIGNIEILLNDATIVVIGAVAGWAIGSLILWLTLESKGLKFQKLQNNNLRITWLRDDGTWNADKETREERIWKERQGIAARPKKFWKGVIGIGIALALVFLTGLIDAAFFEMQGTGADIVSTIGLLLTLLVLSEPLAIFVALQAEKWAYEDGAQYIPGARVKDAGTARTQRDDVIASKTVESQFYDPFKPQ